jgi:hypothetical protein
VLVTCSPHASQAIVPYQEMWASCLAITVATRWEGRGYGTRLWKNESDT